MSEDLTSRLKALLIAAHARGDRAAVRQLLQALQRLRRPETRG